MKFARNIDLGRWRNLSWATCIKSISVEPILLLVALSMSISHVVTSVGLYKVNCQQTYSSNPDVDCDHLANTTVNGQSAETVVQRKVAMWSMGFTISSIAPAFVADIFLGAYSDQHGRKVNILVGIAGLMLSKCGLLLLFAFPLSIHIGLLLITYGLAGCTGSVGITTISSYAYLADTVVNERHLTIRMAILTVVMNLAHIIGPLIGAQVLQKLTRAQTILLCQSLVVTAFVYCVFRIRQVPPAKLRRREKEKFEMELQKSSESIKGDVEQEKVHDDIETTEKKPCFFLAIGLLKDTVCTFTKRREGHIRLYLACACLIYFVNIVSEMGLRSGIFYLYVQKAPLIWDQNMIGYFKSSHSAMTMAGTTVGALILKKWLGFTDTFIVVIATIATIAEMTILAFANTSWMVYASAAAGSLSNLAGPCLQSFVAKQVGPDEVGKAFTAFGLSTTIGMLLSSTIFTPVYYATVDYFPGFVFLFGAILLFAAFIPLLWLHIDSNFKDAGPDAGFWKKLARSVCRAERIGKPATMENCG